MKKIKTSLLAFLLLPCCLLAQIPNADFEQWVPDDPPSYDQEYPQSWSPPPLLGDQHYPVEKVSNPNRGEYAMKVKNNLPTPAAVGGASWPMDALFSPSSQHFRLSMEVRYDSIVPPGKAKVEIRGSGGFLFTHWIDETITGEMETIQIEVELPEMMDQLVLRIQPRGIYNPDYGTPPFNGGYDGYAEIVVDNIVYENVVSSQEPLQKREVHIFPNPASEAAWVKTENGGFIRAINVFNPKGELVLKAKPNKDKYMLDVKGLPSGAYWMEIVLPGKRLIRQWIKG
ncbi:MAG: T9SS type A sorting domain-containing protein [Lewinellaceae bacterium]|nr:T9SS type A sorting domain-containing protein [Phaeodactylibacter sp.]MCB9037663.1 T9SS type A sorting domain-containing protein [Lewinellaceae bacterium]